MEASRLDRLITRQEIADLLDVGAWKLVYAIRNCSNFGLPNPAGRIIKGKSIFIAYDRDEAMAWIATKPFDGIVYGTIVIDKSVFDNEKAILFLSGKFDSLESRLEHMKRLDAALNSGRETTTVHVQERNDYERPHSGLTKQYNGSGEHVMSYGGYGGYGL